MWAVISEISTIIPKSTIPNYMNEVRGKISLGVGIERILLLTWGLSTNLAHLHWYFFICYGLAFISICFALSPILALGLVMMGLAHSSFFKKKVPTQLFNVRRCKLLTLIVKTCSILLMSSCFEWWPWGNDGRRKMSGPLKIGKIRAPESVKSGLVPYKLNGPKLVIN